MLAEAAIIIATGLAAGFAWHGRKQRRRLRSTQENQDTLRAEKAMLAESYEALARAHQAHNAEEHRMFEFLHQLGEALYADNSARKLHRRIVSGAAEVVEARGGALYLHDPVRHMLVPASITRACPPLIELPAGVAEKIGQEPRHIRSYVRLQSIKDQAGALGDVFVTGRPVVLEDLHQHASLSHITAIPGRALAVMIAPLAYGPKKLGVLAVARPRREGAFSAHDFDVFKSLAEQSAFALGNAMDHREAMEKRLMEDELNRASEIQRILLPDRPPAFAGFNLAAAYQPAKVVSGDYYDFIPLDDTHLGIVIADVSGKGMPASLVMATCRGLMRVSAENQFSPAVVLQRVNRLLFGDIRHDMFVSLAYCVLNSETGEVTLARAGHDPPLLFQRADGLVQTLKPPGLALGVDKGKVFDRATRETTFHMAAGDRFLLYTDGVTEALDAKSLDEFGLSRLSDVFREQSAADSAPAALLNAVQEKLAAFTTGARQHDDITLVVIERK